jgi:hypothetical protein
MSVAKKMSKEVVLFSNANGIQASLQFKRRRKSQSVLVIPFQERCMNRGNGWMSLF